MSPAETAYRFRLEREAQRMSPELARRYLEAYRLIRESLTEAELVRGIRAGSVDRLISELVGDSRLDPSLVRLRAALDRAVLDAATREAGVMPSWLRVGAFDLLNPNVIQAARHFDSLALAGLRDEVRETIRDAVVRGLEAGRNPRTIAREVRGLVGLSPQQARAVETFRLELVTGDRSALTRALGKGVITRPDGSRIMRPAHAGGQGLTARQLATLDRLLGSEAIPPEKIEKMVEAYRKRLEAWNTESRTRTAALQAHKEGQRLSWLDAIERGVVDVSRVRRTWLAVGGPGGDGRNRPHHLVMHGETVGFFERFSNGQLVPGEGDYNCRCGDRVFVARQAMAA